MQRLNDSHSDLVSDALRGLRVQSTVFCYSQLSAPWGFAVRSRDAAAFHVVLSGEAWLETENDGARRRVEEGDLVLLPRGRTHTMRDDPSSGVEWLDDLLGGTSASRLRHGGGGDGTELLCGGFAITGGSPLLDALPAVVHVRSDMADWLAPAVELVRDELASDTPGTDAVVTRLADVLVMQAVRTTVLGEASPVPLRARLDAEIGTALSLVGGQPERQWTVSDLARAVSLSRSTFSQRFRELVGEPPMRYVRRCRLERAAELLRTTPAGLEEIAHRSGYDSAISLSKAFKRAFGITPGAYRRQPTEPDVVQPAATR